MSRDMIGHANHVYDDLSVNTLTVHVIHTGNKDPDFVAIRESGEDGESIIINSREQWKQLDAFVRLAFEELEDMQ